MYRKLFSNGVRCWAIAALALAVLLDLGAQAQAQARYTVSAEQLQQMVAQRFPSRYPVVDWLNMDVQAPVLRLLPDQNRLSADMPVQVTGPALPRSQNGTLEVDFALRYDASDRTIRAHKLRFKRLRIADLPLVATDLLNTHMPSIAEQTLQEVVLHQLQPKDLITVDNLGLQPSTITVTDSGLVIGLEVKPLK
jgi:hypothetical protein